MVEQRIKAFGEIDILGNNGGYFGGKVAVPFTKLSAEDWDRNFSVNVKRPFLRAKQLLIT